MSTGRPWMAWYPSDILTDDKYLVLSRSAKLTYRELLDRCWLKGARLPKDEGKLAALAGLSLDEFRSDWREMQDPADPCFVPHPETQGFLTNNRLLAEWHIAESNADRARINGKRGGRPPRINTGEKTQPVISGLARCNPEESSSPSPSPSPEEKDKDSMPEPAAPLRTVPPKNKTLPDYSEDFEAFWLALPAESRHNVSKKLAREKYARARAKTSRDEIMAGVAAMVHQWESRPPGVFVAHPPMATTWLNQERWASDYSMPAPEQARGQPAKADAFDLFLAKHQPNPGETDGPH